MASLIRLSATLIRQGNRMKPRNRTLLAVIDSGDVRRYRSRRVEAKPRKLQHNRARRRTAERKEQE